MSYQRPQLAKNELYHIVSRAVGDIAVFDVEDDFYRGIYSIYEFNNAKPVSIRLRRQQRKKEKNFEKVIATARDTKIYQCSVPQNSQQFSILPPQRNKFVEVFAFSFMPNHLHLIIKQLVENGITEFMKKVNGGYAKYFNDKYKRKGHLFSRFRVVHIKTDEQLKNAFVYVHANLISLIEPSWREKGIKNPDKVTEFLENNKRHSYPDYLGKKNFPSVTERVFLSEIMGGPKGCKTEINNWIRYKKGLKDFDDIALE